LCKYNTNNNFPRGLDVAEWQERLTANAEVATVLWPNS
jgi:hypothetical protein